MTAQISKRFRDIYYQHGVFTFLLFFAPLIPGVIEYHTKSYLSILQAITGTVDDAHRAISTAFGNRGLKVYKQHLENNPKLLRAAPILRTIYYNQDLPTALKLIDQLYFSPQQRRHPLSEAMRATIITQIPNILEHISDDQYQDFRSQLINQLATLMKIEKAIKPRLAFVQTAKLLLNKTSHLSNRILQQRLDLQLANLSQKIKAELAGSASPYTATFSHLTSATKTSHILTQKDVDILIDCLSHVSQTKTPEVSEAASCALFETQNYNLQVVV